MTFWNWRRGPGPAAVGSSAIASSAELAPIELYTADSRVVGWLAPDGHRVTDLLNTVDEIRLWRPSPGTMFEAEMPSGNGAIGGASGEWETLPVSRIILAMPPEWRASRQLRLHRRLRRAALVAGPFSVTGNIHLATGVQVGPHLLRGNAFLPMTDAYLLYTGDPSFEHVVSVVIVNTSHVSQIAALVTLA